MSASHPPFADPVDIPQTWRRWWHARPRWLKIVVWCVFLGVLLHAFVVIRVWIGLKETPEMQRIRALGGSFGYRSSVSATLYPDPRWRHFADGFWGRSNRDVTSIFLQYAGTDELLSWICDEFPNVQLLMISESPITLAGISHVPRLSKLHYLNLRSTNVDDRAAEILSQLSNLQTLDVQETLLTDAAIPRLMKNASITCLEVGGTEIGRDAYDRWLNSRNNPALVRSIAPSQENVPILGSIRWADGSASAVICGRVEISASCRRTDGMVVEKDRLEFCFSRSLGKILFEELADGADGEYRFVLTLNGHASAPVTFQVTNGRPSITRMEFVMPVDQDTVSAQGSEYFREFLRALRPPR